jgi:hypothetical protein
MYKSSSIRSGVCPLLAVVGGCHLQVVAADVHVLVGDELFPEPVRLPYEHHLLDGHVLGLRQEERDEDGHDDDPSAEEVEEAELEVAEHGEEGLRDAEGEEHVDGDVDALPRRPDLQREDLRRHQPPQRAPRPGEARHVDADEEHHHRRVALGHLADAAGAELGGDQRPHHHLADDHLGAALQEQHAPPEPVDGEDGHHGGEHVDEAGDDGGHERGVALEPQRLEQHRRVEHDHVDAGELLEEGDHDRHRQLRPVPALQDVAPRVAHLPRLLARRHQVRVLLADLLRAADPAEHAAGLVGVPALQQRVGGVGQEEGAQGDDAGGDRRQRQADAPPVAGLDLVGAVVDELRRQDADGDHQLEPDVEHAAEARRRHLRQVHRHRLHHRSTGWK